MISKNPIQANLRKKSYVNGKKLVITTADFLKALEKAGGEAKITPLYNAFDKTNFPDVEPAKLKTALRGKGLKLSVQGKILAVHVNGSRAYTFKEVKKIDV